jgi:predicted RNA-binding Zn ribbon-like protein
MAGEMNEWRLRPATQPGGRPPAPGELALVQAFINTHYDLEVEHGAELFATPAGLATWLAARGLIETQVDVGDRELGWALAAREALRGLARANGASPDGALEAVGHLATPSPVEQLARAAQGAPIEVRFGPAGPRFVGGDRGLPGAIGLLLAITARSMIEGSWSRLKVCPGHDCGWAFYDHSRNQTGRWCSMSVCGGRAKARAHYQRVRGAQR